MEQRLYMRTAVLLGRNSKMRHEELHKATGECAEPYQADASSVQALKSRSVSILNCITVNIPCLFTQKCQWPIAVSAYMKTRTRL